MKQQRFAVIVLFALIIASSLTSIGSYSSTCRLVNEDMDRALALALQEQQSDVISQDTIRTFNNHLQITELRGKATLAVDTCGQKFKAYAHCSEATIFSLSDQRPATILWALTGFWAMLICYRHRQSLVGEPLSVSNTNRNVFGGLTYLEDDGCFYAADGRQVQLTPMQHQLMEMFFLSPSHSLTKTEICNALWPKKPDASETLYTLIRRLKPVVEHHSDLKIESDRSKAYRLEIR
ncbi:helix-turn-helix domain-containing protein [Xylanibacter ruminicola]|uniref:Transcriptional regulatory protein, C terminal n=1 Tax=Xylanibacter ruminicola TaxID=839 RepID=A0A1M6WCZ7_XYLRU|nr:helix-turn-helix domain-containing protein [Xylanibacter ruminicola]SHK91544.1 Transcriptional regulatory protein, C terminal [Xylanibacter ruminicola]